MTVNNELEIMLYSPGGTEESHEKPVKIGGSRIEIWDRCLPGTQ